MPASPSTFLAASASSDKTVAVSGLSFTYAGEAVPALRGLDLELRSGESLLVLGPSGSGKSTLTMSLNGLIPHLVHGEMAGRVTVAGLVTSDHPVHELATEVGLVFQDPESQFCALTVEDEVAFGLENLCREPAEIEIRIDRALVDVGLDGFRARDLSRLSGGEKQRVALAAVLAMGPKVLVLDEPSANLDPSTASDLFRLLRALAETRELTLIVIEHRLDQLAEWMDSVLVLSADGGSAAQGPPSDVMYEDGRLASHGVWEPAVVPLVRTLRQAGWPIPGHPLGVTSAKKAMERTPGLIERLRQGATDAVSGPERSLGSSTGRLDGRVMLQVRGLTFRYPGQEVGSRAALDSVSLDVGSGGLLALVGANGAGKTTLASLVSGVLAPPPGTVFLDGIDIAGMRQQDLTAAVGYVFQNPEHQFVTDTVYDELAFSLMQRRGHRSLTAEQERTVESWLDRFGLLTYVDRNPFTLSQGEKRRLSVAAMLIRGQRMIVLDEPTFGQDQTQTTRLMATLQALRAEGRTMVMVTHDMNLVAAHAECVVVLAGGRVVFTGDPHRLFSEPDILREAHLELPALGRLALEIDAPGLLTLEGYVAAAGLGPAAATPGGAPS